MQMQVLLNDVTVGVLTRAPDERVEFVLRREYIEMHPRPVLGQQFEDDPQGRWASKVTLPPFFSNLLPEGKLRDYVSHLAGVRREREFFLLGFLGLDLPGAVQVVESDPVQLDLPEDNDAEAHDQVAGEKQMKFSLAGVQLKLSALREGRGLTIPVEGRGGNWIVKLPDPRFPRVPRTEWSTMHWAQRAGLPVPRIELVSLSDIHGLPDDAYTGKEDKAYAIERFDRSKRGRIHTEDFAQVLGVRPAAKYENANYETIARNVLAIAGVEAFLRFVRQLVFVILSGNGDAHLKNWSLIYRDGVRADLAPPYDLVSTILYNPKDTLGLNLAKNKAFERVTIADFERLAQKIGADPKVVTGAASDAATMTRDAWNAVRDEVSLANDSKAAIQAHLDRVPLK